MSLRSIAASDIDRLAKDTSYMNDFEFLRNYIESILDKVRIERPMDQFR